MTTTERMAALHMLRRGELPRMETIRLVSELCSDCQTAAATLRAVAGRLPDGLDEARDDINLVAQQLEGWWI